MRLINRYKITVKIGLILLIITPMFISNTNAQDYDVDDEAAIAAVKAIEWLIKNNDSYLASVKNGNYCVTCSPVMKLGEKSAPLSIAGMALLTTIKSPKVLRLLSNHGISEQNLEIEINKISLFLNSV